MPWTESDYPNSWKNFSAEVRRKAIEIGNALLEEGYEDSHAIPIATKQATQWGENRGKEIKQSKSL